MKARIFSNNFKFIDDLCTFNNIEFESNYNDIYPDEPELKKENSYPCKASFLDLSVEVRDSKFSTELFDKRDNLSLYINHMPYLDSNVPPKIYYASIGSEIVCIARTTTDLINMVKRVNLLLLRMKSKLVNVPASFHY